MPYRLKPSGIVESSSARALPPKNTPAQPAAAACKNSRREGGKEVGTGALRKSVFWTEAARGGESIQPLPHPDPLPEYRERERLRSFGNSSRKQLPHHAGLGHAGVGQRFVAAMVPERQFIVVQ